MDCYTSILRCSIRDFRSAGAPTARHSRPSAIANWTIGNRQSAIGNWQSAIGNRQLAMLASAHELPGHGRGGLHRLARVRAPAGPGPHGLDIR
ncbi:MAG: hypothetical protein DME25_05705 [Verrucomicrobia bacterium]|nr:MAG: hypothetical protein DME25_05705 [Verrucomicrobiota bacterium]